MMALEICVDSVESAVAAEVGGALRVELCSALSEGGITPSAGMIRAVRSQIKIGVHVMIRPRGGDFLYSEQELAVMRTDIGFARECGANGVVLGVLTKESRVDVERTRGLVELARPMEVTFHRALDMTINLVSAFGDVIQTGANRVLTSGGGESAMAGKDRIQEMVMASRGRIQVMVGGGVQSENAAELASATGATEFHASLRRVVSSPALHKPNGLHLGSSNFNDHERGIVLAEDVRRLHNAITKALIQNH